jgi:hypothetical protein
MHLTKEEEALLEGEKGEALSFAMKVLVNLGDLEKAENFVPIRSAHVSGVSYHTSGEALITLLRRLNEMDARVSVPASLNPAGMDLDNWKMLGYPEDFAEKQLEIIDLYGRLGIDITCSCIPYETPHRMEPIEKGDHLSWGESNAVIYANSMVGARTNREGGISALASAILGKTPDWGMHREENRCPTLVVDVLDELDPFKFNLLGAFIGKNFNSEVAHFRGITIPTIKADLKHLGAALAAKGGHAIYHVEGITPEDGLIKYSEEKGIIKETISITADELASMKDDLYPYEGDGPDVFVLGCPQFGISEFQRLYILLNGRKISKDLRIIVYTNRALREMLDPKVLRGIIESGVEVYDDTCMVVTPLDRLGFKRVGTDSAKAAHYIPKMSHIPADLMPLEMIVERSCE